MLATFKAFAVKVVMLAVTVFSELLLILPVGTVSPPLNVASPFTFKVLFIYALFATDNPPSVLMLPVSPSKDVASALPSISLTPEKLRHILTTLEIMSA